MDQHGVVERLESGKIAGDEADAKFDGLPVEVCDFEV